MMLNHIHSVTFSFHWARFTEVGYFAVEKTQV